MRQYRKSFHDHDPSVHLDAGFQPNAVSCFNCFQCSNLTPTLQQQEPPEWAKEPMSGMIKVHEHLETLSPQSLNAPMPHRRQHSYAESAVFQEQYRVYLQHIGRMQVIGLSTG
jgi:hypothetical protein